MDNKQLYETIMTQVSKEVKKALNESLDEIEDNDKTIVITKKMWEDLVNKVDTIEENVNSIEEDVNAIARRVGYDNSGYNPYRY